MPSVELVCSVAALSVATHLIFKTHEPTSPLPVLLALLLVPPLPAYALHAPLLPSYTLYPFFLALSIALYRLSPWHPLAAIPGPPLARLTKFWAMYITHTGAQHRTYRALHARYGPLVRVGPNELSAAAPDAVVSVLGATGLPKGRYYAARQDPHAPANLITLSGDRHARRRRRWNAGMGASASAEYLPVLVRRAQALVRRIGDAIDEGKKVEGGEGWGAKVDVAAWIRYFSFDFTGDMAFGGGFEMLRDGGDKEGLTHLFDSGARTLSHVSHIPWIAQTLRRIPGATATVLKMRAFGLRCATKRIERGAEVKDLWYHLSDEAGTFPPKPPLAEVIADGALVILAGSDTTTTVLSVLMYLLLTHPAAHARLRAEVDGARETEEGVLDAEHLEQLPFLNACLNEAMRLHPAVPVGGPRRVPDDGPSRVIAGQVVPPGTEIYVPPYCLHRDPQNFAPHTDDFWPERWILADAEASGASAPGTTADAKLIAHDKAAFIPFSYGPQNCAGKPLAWLEMRLVAAMLVRAFDMRMVRESERWTEGLRDYFILERGPLVVRMERRAQAAGVGV
ncbi:cytochrome P450 [Dentipellis sp. KUC8613]|nr:cytochrome P450 [Dentipellis sp. KUC8613]